MDLETVGGLGHGVAMLCRKPIWDMSSRAMKLLCKGPSHISALTLLEPLIEYKPPTEANAERSPSSNDSLPEVSGEMKQGRLRGSHWIWKLRGKRHQPSELEVRSIVERQSRSKAGHREQ